MQFTKQKELELRQAAAEGDFGTVRKLIETDKINVNATGLGSGR